MTVTKYSRSNKPSGTELFNEVEVLLGNECGCGRKGLECIQEEGGCCFPACDLPYWCQKETLTRLKEALDRLDEFRWKEEEEWKKRNKERKEALLEQEAKEEEEEGNDKNDCN